MKALLFTLILSALSSSSFASAVGSASAECKVYEDAGHGYSWTNRAVADLQNPAKIYGVKVVVYLEAQPDQTFLLTVQGPRNKTDLLRLSSKQAGVLRVNRLKYECSVQ